MSADAAAPALGKPTRRRRPRWLGIPVSPLTARRLEMFRRNRRAKWSLRIFLTLLTVSLFAEVIANDRPLYISYNDKSYYPILYFYPDTEFPGGFIGTEPDYYKSLFVEELEADGGWMLWPPIRYKYDTEEYVPNPPPVVQPPSWMRAFCWPVDPADMTVSRGRVAVGFPASLCPHSASLTRNEGESDAAFSQRLIEEETRVRAEQIALYERMGPWRHLLGTEGGNHDLLANLIYGFRLSVIFALVLTFFASIIGIAAGAVQGYFGGWTDLIFQRIIEIWSSLPSLYILLIMSTFFAPGFVSILLILLLFSWMALVGVVRAEFLRVRNFDYIRAARALGVRSTTIMWRHMLPNAMVATLSLLPFQLSGAVTTLTALDFLGLGLQDVTASLGDLLVQAKESYEAPWLGISVFITLALLLSLLTFIGEGVRDAFDPRKGLAAAVAIPVDSAAEAAAEADGAPLQPLHTSKGTAGKGTAG